MSRRQKIGRILLGILVVLALFVGYQFIPESVDLEEFRTLNEQYDVEILRDSYGVPHIYGQTDPDTAFGLAYAHAEDDFLLIQDTLAATRGRSAYYNGADAAPIDFIVQLFRTWETIDARYEQDLSSETRALIEAYADGINYYASLNEDEAYPDLYPVSGKDIVAGFVVRTPLFFGIDGVLTELFADERRRPVSPDPVASDDLGSWTYYGSNAIAVNSPLAAADETFLAVNSHQPWEGPVTWYEAHVHSEEGWDMTGGIFPGAPIILHGHNRHLGWAFTVNSPDLVDVYVLEINPDNPDQYRFDGKWRDLEVAEAEIPVKLFGRFRWTVKQEILWSVYGPTVRQPHGTYALRYATMGEIDLVESWYQMNKATDLESWQAILFASNMPMFNVGYADKAGNIYYLYNARLPIRAEGYDWEQYLPGNTSATLWTAYLPSQLLPQLLNPASGFIQNANSSPYQTTIGEGNPIEADFSPTFGIENNMSNRAVRLLELLGADEEITFAEFITYKYDMTYADSSMPVLLWDRLLAADFTGDSDLLAAQTVLADWDQSAHPDSESASLLLLTLYLLNDKEDVDLGGSNLIGGNVPQTALEEAFQEAVAHLLEHFGSINVAWSEINRIQRGDLDVGVGGGPDLPHALYGQFNDNGRLIGGNGDSYVLMVRWDAEGQVTSWSVHQFGSATAVADSPHYNDQVTLFANRELKPVWFEEADVRANLARAYRPGE